jgi:hypothetical protein
MGSIEQAPLPEKQSWAKELLLLSGKIFFSFLFLINY